jgi:hypothetical protein
MYNPDAFLNRAAECERIADFTGDPGSKAAWSRMAERWRRCADVAKMSASSAATHRDTNRHRKHVN